MKTQELGTLTTFILFISLTACSPPDNAIIQPPPPEVEVVLPMIEDTTVYIEFPGKTQASSTVEIRARVKGFLKSQEFRSGQFVDVGESLFTIEPEEFAAAVASANSEVLKAKAELELATTNARKREDAFKNDRSVAEIDWLEAKANRQASKAALEIAKTKLADAERALSYTQIKSPISGRASGNSSSIGSLVGSGEPTLLTTISQENPIHFFFTIDERSILPFLRSRPTPRQPLSLEIENREPDTKLTLANGIEYKHKGKIDFIDNAADSNSGSIRLRAVFPNEDYALTGGLFGRIGIPREINGAVHVPVHAIQRDLAGSFVLVVDPNDLVSRRTVIPTEYLINRFRLVEPYNELSLTGIRPSEKVIVSNLQRARPGTKVSIVPATK